MKTHNKVGPPVEGADFFGRQDEISGSWEDIADGNHLLITAPRRVGKSSFVKRLIGEAKANGWNAAYVDVQDVSNELEFYSTFAETLRQENETWFNKHKQRVFESLGSILSKIEVEGGAYGATVKLKWNGSLTKEMKKEISGLLEGSKDLLIAIDELPFFLARLEKEEDGKQRISDFLHWLRAFRQRSGSKIRWVFCGSVGLDTFTQRLNLTEAFNDIDPHSLGAFEDEVAAEFLKKLGNDNDLVLTDENVQTILKKIGWPLPYFLQALFKQLKRVKAKKRGPVSTEDIYQAYENIIRDNSTLKTWEERLNIQLSTAEADACKALLTAICRETKGLQRRKLYDIIRPLNEDNQRCEDSLSFTLALLERDGYLLVTEGFYAFRSPLLRDYWYKTKVQ